MINICPFCNTRPANKTNSHIISNFLTLSLKDTGKGNKVFSISKYVQSGKYSQSQDSSKEDHIFCPECEDLFNTRFERYIANSFYKAHKQNTDFFNVFISVKELAYRVYTNTNYAQFKKFLFLQLYRAHVSNLSEFKGFVLSKAQYDLIHKNLFDLNYFDDIKVTVFSTDLVADKTENVICAIQVNAESYLIYMNEFICLYEFNSNKSLIPHLDDAVNFKDNSPKVIFLSLKTWQDFMNILVGILARQK
jgi:hypothetical protein